VRLCFNFLCAQGASLNLTIVTLHFLNRLFTFFGNTHYFSHNANLFISIKKTTILAMG